MKLEFVAASLCALMGSCIANAQQNTANGFRFVPNNLVVSRSVYDNNSGNVVPGTVLPPGCASTTGGCSASTGAPYDGTYPLVWNNDLYDASFGMTSKIFLDEMSPFGFVFGSLEVPNSSMNTVGNTSDQMVNSFNSKSELGLHLSTDGKYLTYGLRRAHRHKSIGEMVFELTEQGLLNQTLIVITAKHGESPIDSGRYTRITTTGPVTTSPGTILQALGLPPGSLTAVQVEGTQVLPTSGIPRH